MLFPQKLISPIYMHNFNSSGRGKRYVCILKFCKNTAAVRSLRLVLPLEILDFFCVDLFQVNIHRDGNYMLTSN